MTAVDVPARAPSIAPFPRSRGGGRPQDQAGTLTYAVLGVTALLFVAPFYYMLVAASRPMAEMNRWPPPLVPGGDLLDNIATAIQQQNIGLALRELVRRLERHHRRHGAVLHARRASRSGRCASAAATCCSRSRSAR